MIGRAGVTSAARRLERPVIFGGVSFPLLLELQIDKLAPLRNGRKLAPLVPRLRETFPDPETWSVRMRRALVPLAPADVRLIDKLLSPLGPPCPKALRSYDLLTPQEVQTG